MKFHFLFFFAFTAFYSATAQQQTGMRLERRAGLYAMTINPAAAGFNPSVWELSLGQADFFALQNYARLEHTSVLKALRHTDWIKTKEQIANQPAGTPAIPVDFYSNGRIYGIAQARVAGPGFTFRLGEYHTFGFSITERFHASSFKAPKVLRYETISNLDFGNTYNIDPVRMSGMEWREISGHYAYSNFDNWVLFSAGVTPKFLIGHQGMYTNVNADFDFSPLSPDTASLNSANWSYAFTNDILYSDDRGAYRPKSNGSGLGIDLGFSWAAPMEDAEGSTEYSWRAGVSITDLGFVRFKRNAERHFIDFNNVTLVPGDTLQATLQNNPENAARELSRFLLGNPDASLQSTKFTIGTPTVLSAQFDYRITPYFYAGAVISQRIPMGKHTLKAANMLAVVPRFEQRWLSFSLPLVLSNYRSPRMGIAGRLAFLYFGTDDIFSWTGKRSLTGADFYVGLKINSFPIRLGMGGGALGSKDRRWKDVGCYH